MGVVNSKMGVTTKIFARSQFYAYLFRNFCGRPYRLLLIIMLEMGDKGLHVAGQSILMS